jgi:hypothetical protein
MLLISRGSDSFHNSAVTIKDVCPNLNNTAVSRLCGTDTSSKRLGNMLKITEDIPISLTRELDTFERLIAQAQEPLPSHEFTLTQAFTDLIEDSLTRGWIYSAALQELVAAMDPRLATAC